MAPGGPVRISTWLSGLKAGSGLRVSDHVLMEWVAGRPGLHIPSTFRTRELDLARLPFCTVGEGALCLAGSAYDAWVLVGRGQTRDAEGVPGMRVIV